MLPILIETGVEGPIGAGRHECGTERLNWRDGYRERTLGRSYIPPFLQARKIAEKALVARRGSVECRQGGRLHGLQSAIHFDTFSLLVR